MGWKEKKLYSQGEGRVVVCPREEEYWSLHSKCIVLAFQYHIVFLSPVIEVACGEYGDMVPKLSVAVKSGRCDKYQNPNRKKMNCVQGKSNGMRRFHSHERLENVDKNEKETAILNDNMDEYEFQMKACENGKILEEDLIGEVYEKFEFKVFLLYC